MENIKSANAVIGSEYITTESIGICESCQYGKAHRLPFSKHMSTQVNDITERVSSDLFMITYFNREGVKVKKYGLTLIDEMSRKVVVYILNLKSQATGRIIEWHKKATTITGKKLREFHSDGGTEYMSEKLQSYFKQHGVMFTITTKGTPQHNGIAERANRTIVEMARSMLLHAHLPSYFWEYAVMTAVYIRNRCLSTQHKTKTPEELWTGRKPYIKHFRVFGCDAYLHIQDKERNKLDPKAIKGIFIGYSAEQQGWKIYDVNTHKVYVNHILH